MLFSIFVFFIWGGGNFCALSGTAGEGVGARAAGQERVCRPCPVQDQLKWEENISAVAHL